MIKHLILKHKLNKLGYKWIHITSQALKDYREQVRGNAELSDWTLQKKLNRNWYMADKSFEGIDAIHKDFGALKIIYSKELNTITAICNHRGQPWQAHGINTEFKNKMNKIYGLK